MGGLRNGRREKIPVSKGNGRVKKKVKKRGKNMHSRGVIVEKRRKLPGRREK